MHRLGKQVELMAVSGCFFEHFARGRLAGDEQDFAGWADPPDFDCQFDAGELGHEHVGEQQVGEIALSGAQGLIGICKGGRVKAGFAQDFCDAPRNQGLVINNEDAQGSLTAIHWLVAGARGMWMLEFRIKRKRTCCVGRRKKGKEEFYFVNAT